MRCFKIVFGNTAYVTVLLWESLVVLLQLKCWKLRFFKNIVMQLFPGAQERTMPTFLPGDRAEGCNTERCNGSKSSNMCVFCRDDKLVLHSALQPFEVFLCPLQFCHQKSSIWNRWGWGGTALSRCGITQDQSHQLFHFALKAECPVTARWWRAKTLTQLPSPKRTLLSRSGSEYAAPSIQLAWEEKTHFVTVLLLTEQSRCPAQEMIHWYQAESQAELAEDHRDRLASGWRWWGGWGGVMRRGGDPDMQPPPCVMPKLHVGWQTFTPPQPRKIPPLWSFEFLRCWFSVVLNCDVL